MRIPARPALAGLILLAIALQAHAGARLELTTVPAGFDAWSDRAYLGRTPLTANLPPGATLLRLSEPSDSLWNAPALDTLLQAVEGETLRIALRIGRRFNVRSRPVGIPVLRDGRELGRTPLEIRLDPEGPDRLSLLTPRGPIPIPPDTLRFRSVWTWRGDDSIFDRHAVRSNSSWRRLGRYGSPILAGALAAGAKLAENAADRSYRRYLRTADPSLVEKYYDETRRRDALATCLWVGAEASLASALLAWIWPDRDDGVGGVGLVGEEPGSLVRVPPWLPGRDPGEPASGGGRAAAGGSR